MRHILRQIVRWLGPVLFACLSSSGASAVVLSALQDGRHVLLMRHADAPGVSDPPGFVLSECATQRNLGPLGRTQARDIGAWLRGLGLAQASVFASPWCRCLETARLLDLGEVRPEASLGSFFEQREQGAAQTRRLQAFVADQLASHPGRPLLLVTHQVNILAYAGESLASGEMLLARVDRQGRVLQVTRQALPPRP